MGDFPPDERATAELTAAERRLIESVVDGTAGDDDLLAADELLQSHEEARAYYLQASRIHAALRWIHRGDDAAANGASASEAAMVAGECDRQAPFLVDLIDRVLDEAPDDVLLPRTERLTLAADAEAPQTRRSATMRRWAGAAVILLLLAGIGGTHLYRSSIDEQRRQIAARTEVAEFRSDRGCIWQDETESPAEGAKLSSGQRLQLVSGSAKLQFNRGAAVVLEGPAEIELISAVSMRLVHGTVAVRVSGPDKEFVVISPDASIVDLGTSFGVHRGANGLTEVEVFEGAVEVFPQGDDANGKVLGVGASARIRGAGIHRGLELGASSTDHFGNLLELLWDDVVLADMEGAPAGEEGVVKADFSDGPVPGAVDTFYGAVPGRGWETPWMASGNPIGRLADDDPLSQVNPALLGLRFHHSYERAVARRYGKRPGFDPSEPHVISWKWRFDGDIDDFAASYRDRISFYGNPFFRRNSWPSNTWLIGVVADHESKGKERMMLPMTWYAYDGDPAGVDKELDRRNMVDTGMKLKPGVIYRFAVAVYPRERRYDVAIQDDEQTFTHDGLTFRDCATEDGRVLHFTASANHPEDDLSFSIDSIRIDSLTSSSALQRAGFNDRKTPESAAD
jgi:hypothetical protein